MRIHVEDAGVEGEGNWILLAVDDARLQRLEHLGERQRRGRSAHQLKGAPPERGLRHTNLQSLQVIRVLHDFVAGELARHAWDASNRAQLRLGCDGAGVFGANGIPDAVLMRHVLEQIRVRPNLGRAVPAGQQPLPRRGYVHRALEQTLDMFALAAKRTSVVGCDLNLAFGEFADAASEYIEPLRDEVGWGRRRCADPLDRLRAKDARHCKNGGPRRQTTHHSAAAYRTGIEAHEHPSRERGIYRQPCTVPWPVSCSHRSTAKGGRQDRSSDCASSLLNPGLSMQATVNG